MIPSFMTKLTIFNKNLFSESCLQSDNNDEQVVLRVNVLFHPKGWLHDEMFYDGHWRRRAEISAGMAYHYTLTTNIRTHFVYFLA